MVSRVSHCQLCGMEIELDGNHHCIDIFANHRLIVTQLTEFIRRGELDGCDMNQARILLDFERKQINAYDSQRIELIRKCFGVIN